MRLLALVLFLAGFSGLGAADWQATGTQPQLPIRLTDQQFWRLSSEFSEPDGDFRSENLVSNEHTFQYVIPSLKRQVKPGGVYLGVAPDQNFTYIIATEPRLAFIVDIRRGNLLQHLMYKVLIEMSVDRADFISRLFSKARPMGIGAASSVTELFAAYADVPTSEDLYRQNVRMLRERLLKRHGFPLTAEELKDLESIYFAFFWEGPSLRYSTSMGPGGGRGGGGGRFPTYQELMIQTDLQGVPHGYLATEAHFRALKFMQERNLIVPVVGNFAGPKALRAVGRYVRERRATVTTFYVSNVEQYLFQDGVFEAFARNVATLPVDASSTFVRSVSRKFTYRGTGIWPDDRATALDPIGLFVRDFEAGRIQTYFDVNSRSK